MAVTVAEYLGVNANAAAPWVPGTPIPDCPFMGLPCTKLNRKQPQKPVCSVFADGGLWITCEQRLLSAAQSVEPTQAYFSQRAAEIAEIIWGTGIPASNVAVVRQHTIGTSSADFVFAYNPGWRVVPLPLRFVMEVQGGGPTNSTGEITRHVADWENGVAGVQLTNPVVNSSADIRGVWKRLLEQLFTKGLAATKVRQGIGCVVGAKLFDAVNQWVRWSELKPPEDKYVDFIVIPYRVADAATSPVRLEPDTARVVRSSFRAFLEQLQKVGIDANFAGRYTTLSGDDVEGS